MKKLNLPCLIPNAKSAEKKYDAVEDNLSEDQKMLVELFSLLCGAAAYYKGIKSTYFDCVGGDERKFSREHLELQIDPAVYLSARLHALKQEYPCDGMDIVFALPNAYPTVFELSEDEKLLVQDDLKKEGFKAYMESPSFNSAHPESKES